MYGKCHILNIEHIPFKINKAKVPPLMTSVLPCTAKFTYYSKQEKDTEVTKIGKEETKLSLFADNIIFLCVKSKTIYKLFE